jgi:hypothetical protein
MSNDRTMWFRSKIDWWLGLVLAAAPVVTVVAALTAPADERFAAYGSTLLLVGIYFGLVFPMTYGVDDSYLLVRHGLVRRRIPLAAITEVRPTHNPLSSPALSLDRLRITYGKGLFKSVMISPADKRGFLTELALRALLTRNGDGLVR